MFDRRVYRVAAVAAHRIGAYAKCGPYYVHLKQIQAVTVGRNEDVGMLTIGNFIFFLLLFITPVPKARS